MSFEDEQWVEGFKTAFELCYSMAKDAETKAVIFFFLSLVKAEDYEQLKALLDRLVT